MTPHIKDGLFSAIPGIPISDHFPVTATFGYYTTEGNLPPIAIDDTVVILGDQIPMKFVLNQNYPNPFNPSTTISYSLSQRFEVVLTIYNLLGQEVKTLINEIQTPGNKWITWDGRDNQVDIVGSGVYIYSIRTGTRIEARKNGSFALKESSRIS